MERLLTAAEVAGLLAVKPEWVHRRAREGALVSYKVDGHKLRFREADVELYLSARRRGPKISGLTAIKGGRK